jgi:pyruvate/2-oxoglutarate dehydrogenase complex dihydrolipoamide acyltransferase (E2) component
MIPVPMTVLAPAEIVAENPVVIAAPLDGVIRSIDVDPDSTVKPGDVLFHMHDSELRSAYEVARKGADVAEARWRRAQQGASISPDLRREAGLAEAEFEAAAAQRDAALSRLERSVVRADAGGTAMFNNKDDWAGKPVSTGERIIAIADPQRVEARIELGLADSIVLENPRHVTLFLDSNPLEPVNATFLSAAYQAMPTRNNTLAFTVRAKPQADAVHRLRIGQRGTAQIRSDKVSLAYFLLRRPLSILRQRVGL